MLRGLIGGWNMIKEDKNKMSRYEVMKKNYKKLSSAGKRHIVTIVDKIKHSVKLKKHA